MTATLPTPQRWLDPAWQAAALAWADDVLGGLGLERTGWSHPHVRPWSTVLRIETSGDPVWLKAPGDGARYEVALLALLAELDAPSTPRPLAASVDDGWLLLPDGGPVSRAAHGGLTPVDVSVGQLAEYAALQRALEPHVQRLLLAGPRDLRPALMPQVLAQTVAVLEAERPPARLSADDAARLRAVLPAYAEACAELAGSGISPTLQHDDLHDNNILVRGPVFIDWGDSCVGHPFGTMLATLRSIAHHHGLAPDDPALARVADAYTEAWTDIADRATLRRQVELALRVGPLTRSLSYRQALTHVDDTAWQADADAMPEWLLEMLEPDLPLHPALLG
ncbi:MAG: phosphotransferase [Candidatus Nanopelagicales bacterium]